MPTYCSTPISGVDGENSKAFTGKYSVFTVISVRQFIASLVFRTSRLLLKTVVDLYWSWNEDFYHIMRSL